MSIVSEIKKNKMKVFRRLYMKRRLSGGEYETTWQLIPNEYVIKWGNVQYSVDDVKPDFYKFSGLTFQVTNYDGYFAPETDDKSFFYQSLTRMNTLVKIEAGYEASDGTEYPTDPTLYIGLLSDKMEYKQDAKVNFKTNHLSSVLDDIPADRLTIAGSGTYTASGIVELIKDFQDAGSTYFFQKFITSGAWNYSATTDYYVLETNTTLQNLSCWKLLQKIAGAENKVVYIDRTGEFYFTSKDISSSVTAFKFSGYGDTDRTYGHNVMDYLSVDENIKKVYNRVKVKHGQEDTTTNYYIRNETWQWGDSSSSFMYGVREYSYDNTFLNASTATLKANDIYNEYVTPKQEIKLRAKFVPHLMVQDYVTATYKKQRYFGDALWGFFNWGEAVWGNREGYNILLDNQGGRITTLKHNLDKMSSDVTMRAL